MRLVTAGEHPADLDLRPFRGAGPRTATAGPRTATAVGRLRGAGRRMALGNHRHEAGGCVVGDDFVARGGRRGSGRDVAHDLVTGGGLADERRGRVGDGCWTRAGEKSGTPGKRRRRGGFVATAGRRIRRRGGETWRAVPGVRPRGGGVVATGPRIQDAGRRRGSPAGAGFSSRGRRKSNAMLGGQPRQPPAELQRPGALRSDSPSLTEQTNSCRYRTDSMTLLRDIQEAVLDSSVNLPDLLRRAGGSCARLRHKEFAFWVGRELSGYADSDDLPEYRRLDVMSLGHFWDHFGSAIKNAPIRVALLPESRHIA